MFEVLALGWSSEFRPHLKRGPDSKTIFNRTPCLAISPLGHASILNACGAVATLASPPRCVASKLEGVASMQNCTTRYVQMFEQALTLDLSCHIARDCPALLSREDLIGTCNRKRRQDGCECVRAAVVAERRSQELGSDSDVEVNAAVQAKFSDITWARRPELPPRLMGPDDRVDAVTGEIADPSKPRAHLLRLVEPTARSMWASGREHIVTWEQDPNVWGKRLMLSMLSSTTADAPAANIVILRPTSSASTLSGRGGAVRFVIPETAPPGTYTITAALYAAASETDGAGGWAPVPYGLKLGVGRQPSADAARAKDCVKAYDDSSQKEVFAVCGAHGQTDARPCPFP